MRLPVEVDPQPIVIADAMLNLYDDATEVLMIFARGLAGRASDDFNDVQMFLEREATREGDAEALAQLARALSDAAAASSDQPPASSGKGLTGKAQGAETFPKPRRKDGEPPCGECHLQPGETCDICGAVAPPASSGQGGR